MLKRLRIEKNRVTLHDFNGQCLIVPINGKQYKKFRYKMLREQNYIRKANRFFPANPFKNDANFRITVYLNKHKCNYRTKKCRCKTEAGYRHLIFYGVFDFTKRKRIVCIYIGYELNFYAFTVLDRGIGKLI